MTAKRITKTFPAYREESVTADAKMVAQSRTAHLETLAFREPVQELLCSAYLQGVVDAYRAMTREAADAP